MKLLKKEKNFRRSSHSHDMNFFWELAVCLICLMAILSIFFGFYLFMKINKETASVSAEAVGQVETVKKERIDKVLEYFSLRNKKSIQIINSPSPVVDPSL